VNVFGKDVYAAEAYLVVRLGAIGDVLRVCPALAALRKARPDAKIGWAVEGWAAPLLKYCPAIDRLHLLDRGALSAGWGAAIQEMRRFVQELREAHYTVALDFHGRFKSGWVTRFSGATTRIGYAQGQSTEFNHLFTNRQIRLSDPKENRVLRFLNLLKPLEMDARFDLNDIGIVLPEAEMAAARQGYAEMGRPDLAVFAGCSTHQSAYHRWPMEKWIALLQQTGKAGISSVLFWGPDEAELSQKIVEAAGTGCRLAPQTALVEMMARIGCFPAFIGGNTAAMHMAWMQGVPTVFFPGPADPKTDGPLDPVPGFPLRAEHLLRADRSKRHQAEVTSAVSVEEAFAAVQACLDVGVSRKNNATLYLRSG